jgi:hypothetical protein
VAKKKQQNSYLKSRLEEQKKPGTYSERRWI